MEYTGYSCTDFKCGCTEQTMTGLWMEGVESHKVIIFMPQWKAILQTHKLYDKRTAVDIPPSTLFISYVQANMCASKHPLYAAYFHV